MSRGSKVILTRIPKKLLEEISQAVQSANRVTRGEPYTVSSWVRKCICEKLNHLKRSKKTVEPSGEFDALIEEFQSKEGAQAGE